LSAKLLSSATAIIAVVLFVSCAKHEGPHAGSASSNAAPLAAATPKSAAASPSAASPSTASQTTVSSPASPDAKTNAPGAPAGGSSNSASPSNSADTAVFDFFTAGPRKTAIVAEIDQLHQALTAYKEKHLLYPHSPAAVDLNVRKMKFMRHMRSVYPASTYGVLATHFDRLRDYVQANYKVRGGENVVALDLGRLDSAEALVFYLGGFPTPVGQSGMPLGPDQLFGFNKDPGAPLKRSLPEEDGDPRATRTGVLFDFDRKRLVDQDADGWWEYLPTPPKNGAPGAPFVYFDYDVYADAEKKPTFDVYPTDPELAAKIGTAVPLAAYFDPTGRAPIRWQNPQSFQILCGGLDGKYSSPKASLRVTIFPSGRVYLAPNFSDPPGNYDPEELDNLTNLVRSTLGEAQAEAR